MAWCLVKALGQLYLYLLSTNLPIIHEIRCTRSDILIQNSLSILPVALPYAFP